MQVAKYIDINRSYVPVDPRTFPESLHTNSVVETPEDKIPVVPFDGQNFMPTAYGYRSYFGVGQTLNINPLDARVNHIFIYQSVKLENILIALADTGIWYKSGQETGSWEQLAETDPGADLDVVYMWTYCILNNDLYAYRQGDAEFYRIVTDADGNVTVDVLTPNFLNMEGQVGIFKAGSRLGFWDTDNALSWSSIDDFEDFTPSVTTLAGGAKFDEMIGTIVTILGHGDGFMIYATKSILYIQKAVDSLFQWKPNVVMQNNGIVYDRQAVSAVPDTTHFAYTPNGLFRIENGVSQVLVPEATDFFAESAIPKTLKILQGRYLFIEVYDANLMTGKAIYREGSVPPGTVVYPGYQDILAEAIEEAIISTDGDAALCPVFDKASGPGFGDQIPGPGSGIPPPDDADPENPDYQLEWTCYIKGVNIPDEIVWDNSPCAAPPLDGGEDHNMNPGFAYWNDDTGNTATPQALDGDDVWTDGRWTMERFVKYQQALWDLEEQKLQAFRQQAESRTGTSESSTWGNAISTTPTTIAKCATNFSVPTGFTRGFFGLNACSFWLTRYALGIDKLFVRSRLNRSWDDTVRSADAPTGYTVTNAWDDPRFVSGSIGGVISKYSDLRDVPCAAGRDRSSGVYSTPGGVAVHPLVAIINAETGSEVVGGEQHVVSEFWVAPAGFGLYTAEPYGVKVPPTFIDARGRYKVTDRRTYYNEFEPHSVGLLPDTAYCERKGWNYKKADGTRGFMAATSCSNTTSDLDGSEDRTAPPNPNGPGQQTMSPADEDGSICGLPFEPIEIPVPGEPPVIIDWPDETITYPGSTFLLRTGSNVLIYPTAAGAYVYDMHLKKWGKMVQPYKHLLDYSPINAAVDNILPTATFGVNGGILAVGGTVKLFDQYPTFSWITYGKIGYYREGKTSLEEMHIEFRDLCTGSMRVDVSLNGKNLTAGLSKTAVYENERTVTLYGIYPGKWHTVTIEGFYDLTYMEYKGFRQGRR